MCCLKSGTLDSVSLVIHILVSAYGLSSVFMLLGKLVITTSSSFREFQIKENAG